MFRIAIFRLDEAEYAVVWTFPHILLDGRSFPIVLGEVFGVYDAVRRGETLELPRPRPYREHVQWLARQDWSGAESFWRSRLAGFRDATPLPGADPDTGETRVERGEQDLRLSRELTPDPVASGRRRATR